MRKGCAVVLIAIGGLGLLSVAQLFTVNPARVRESFVGMVLLPGGMIALGWYLLKKPRASEVVDAEIVDEPQPK